MGGAGSKGGVASWLVSGLMGVKPTSQQAADVMYWPGGADEWRPRHPVLLPAPLLAGRARPPDALGAHDPERPLRRLRADVVHDRRDVHTRSVTRSHVTAPRVDPHPRQAAV